MQFRLDFSHERDISIDVLVNRIKGYYPEADFVMLRKAYFYSERAHAGQKRSSGEDFFVHPVNVALTLIKLRMDLSSIIAGLLHDVIEDCKISEEEIRTEFSNEVAQIVRGLTKISKIKFKTKEESQAENFRKMVVAMAEDLRVIIVKLSDRMHNMRTLQYISDERQKKVAQETLDIYVPLASRLGINSVKADLEDLCLRFLKPEIYYRLAEKVTMKRSERESYIKDVISIIQDKLLEYSLKADVKGRPKHFYSIFKKMSARGVDFDQIQDVLAFRIVVSNITECYKALGIIHSAFTPIPGRFKDYIAIPKVNNYQSLHTTVIGPNVERIEIQIRTHEMDEVAETGIAAHWKYKEVGSGSVKLKWVQELLEFNYNLKSNQEFMDVVKKDIDVGGVLVFTPKGEVLEFCYGATPLDFAYSVHTEIGHHCVGAKVNGKIVPLRYGLKSGDSVEVLTSKSQTPSKDWLNIVKTSRAKTKIKQWLLKIERERNKELGKETLEKVFRVFSTSIKSLKKKGEFEDIIKGCGVSNEDELLINVGSGKYTPKHVVSFVPSIATIHDEKEADEKMDKLNSFSQKISESARKTAHKDDAVIVDGMDDVLIRIARCCNPIPGDPIVGYITRGRGIAVHTATCDRVQTFVEERSVNVAWNPDFNFKHSVNVRIVTNDSPGMLTILSKAINNADINIRSAMAKSLSDFKANFIFEIEVTDYSELLKVINSIEAMEEVISVTRA